MVRSSSVPNCQRQAPRVHTTSATIDGEPDCVELGEILHLRMRITSWLDGTKKQRAQAQGERPWYSSPFFGRPEKVRESWNNVLHSSAEHLLHRITKFLVSFESGDRLKKNDERGSPKVAGNPWRTAAGSEELQLCGSSRCMPRGLRKEPAPWSYTIGGIILAREPRE